MCKGRAKNAGILIFLVLLLIIPALIGSGAAYAVDARDVEIVYGNIMQTSMFNGTLKVFDSEETEVAAKGPPTSTGTPATQKITTVKYDLTPGEYTFELTSPTVGQSEGIFIIEEGSGTQQLILTALQVTNLSNATCTLRDYLGNDIAPCPGLGSGNKNYVVVARDANKPYSYTIISGDSSKAPIMKEHYWDSITTNLAKTAMTVATNRIVPIFYEMRTLDVEVTSGAEIHIYQRGYSYSPHIEYTGEFKGTSGGYDQYIFTVPENSQLRFEAGGMNAAGQTKYLRVCQDITIKSAYNQTLRFDLEELDNNRRVDNKHMAANLYLNVDDSRYETLGVGETLELLPIRVWQAMLGETTNNVSEPDFHFEVIGNSIELEESANSARGRQTYTVTAKEPGLSIIKITYDAIAWHNTVILETDTYTHPGDYANYFNAIEPANTGIIIVNVDADNSAGIQTNIGQTEYDTIYFDKAIGYAGYTFKPTANSGTVSVRTHDPLHNTEWGAGWHNAVKNSDGSFTVKLKDGRNIIEVSADGSVVYHVVNARETEITITNLSNPAWEKGEPLLAGETVSINFTNLESPVHKMAGIYNPGYGSTCYVQYETPAGRQIKSGGTQYDLVREHTLSFVVTEPGELILQSGRIHSTHLGKALGFHKNIPTRGMPQDFNAREQTNPEWFGALPEIKLNVVGNDYVQEQSKLEYCSLTAVKDEESIYLAFDSASQNQVFPRNHGLLRNTRLSVANGTGVNLQFRTWQNSIISDALFIAYDSVQSMIDGGANGVGYGEILVTPKNPSDGFPKTYTFRVLNPDGSAYGNSPYITDLKLAAVNGAADMDFFHGRLKAEAELDLGYGFLSTRASFTTSVPYSVDKIKLTASPLTEGGTTTEVSMKLGSGSEENGVQQTFDLAVGVNTITVTGTVGSETVSYTAKVTREAEPNIISFNTVSESSLIIKTAAGKTVATLTGADASHKLPVADGYVYYYSKEGYFTKTGSFDVAADTSGIPLPAFEDSDKTNQTSGSAKVTIVSHNSVLRDSLSISYDINSIPDLAKEGYVAYNSGGYTVLHALLAAMDSGQVKVGYTCYLGNLRPDVTAGSSVADGAGWVCEVNGASIPANEISTTIVHPDDDIRYFYNANHSGMKYVWFDERDVRVYQGEEAKFTLLGKSVNTEDSAGPIQGAKILINGQESSYVTDENGEVTIPTASMSLNSHVITAVLKNGTTNILTYNQAVLMVRKSQNESSSEGFYVSFRLIGAEKHGKSGYGADTKYLNWIKTVRYPLSSKTDTATVYEVFDWALKNAGLQYIEGQRNYISSIKAPYGYNAYWLAEFDNGPNSGWMYTVNGYHPEYGLRDYRVGAGDEIIWHYVDDYILETNFEGRTARYPNGWLSAADDNPPTEPRDDPKNDLKDATILTPKATASNGVATASVSAADMSKAIDDARTNESGAIIIAPEISGSANKVSVELPKASVSAIGTDTSADLTIRTPVGSVTIPNGTLASIAAQAGGSTVTIAAEAVEASTLTAEQQKLVGDNPVFDISIISGGKHISSFDGRSITISLPYTLRAGESAGGVAVWYLNDAGKLERMTCAYDGATGLATFTTTHLSSYLVGYDAWKNPFADVKAGDWFYDAVRFAVERELFNGISATTFWPNAEMTRAMLVTVLYRLDGKPAVSTANSFTDVQDGQWYTDAVLWANANGIVTGHGNSLFGTNDPITREQMAAMLFRYAGYKKYDTAKTNALAAYTDAGSIAAYALDAMKWANAEGLITGRTETTLAPAGTATRAEVATILMRFNATEKMNREGFQ